MFAWVFLHWIGVGVVQVKRQVGLAGDLVRLACGIFRSPIRSSSRSSSLPPTAASRRTSSAITMSVFSPAITDRFVPSKRISRLPSLSDTIHWPSEFCHHQRRLGRCWVTSCFSPVSSLRTHRCHVDLDNHCRDHAYSARISGRNPFHQCERAQRTRRSVHWLGASTLFDRKCPEGRLRCNSTGQKQQCRPEAAWRGQSRDCPSERKRSPRFTPTNRHRQ